MMLVVALIVIEAVQRLLHPAPVAGAAVMGDRRRRTLGESGGRLDVAQAPSQPEQPCRVSARALRCAGLGRRVAGGRDHLADRLAGCRSAAVVRRIHADAGVDVEPAQAVGQRPDGRSAAAFVVPRNRPGAGRHSRRRERARPACLAHVRGADRVVRARADRRSGALAGRVERREEDSARAIRDRACDAAAGLAGRRRQAGAAGDPRGGPRAASSKAAAERKRKRERS